MTKVASFAHVRWGTAFTTPWLLCAHLGHTNSESPVLTESILRLWLVLPMITCVIPNAFKPGQLSWESMETSPFQGHWLWRPADILNQLYSGSVHALKVLQHTSQWLSQCIQGLAAFKVLQHASQRGRQVAQPSGLLQGATLRQHPRQSQLCFRPAHSLRPASHLWVHSLPM